MDRTHQSGTRLSDPPTAASEPSPGAPEPITLKVTAGADAGRAVGRQPAARLPDPGHEILLAAHPPGVALWRLGFPHVIPPVLPGITAPGRPEQPGGTGARHDQPINDHAARQSGLRLTSLIVIAPLHRVCRGHRAFHPVGVRAYSLDDPRKGPVAARRVEVPGPGDAGHDLGGSALSALGEKKPGRQPGGLSPATAAPPRFGRTDRQSERSASPEFRRRGMPLGRFALTRW